MIIKIQLKEKKQAEELNKIATKYTFDIWIHSKDQRMFDAKTLLALYTLPLNEELDLVVEDDVNAKALIKDLEEFILL